MSRWNRMRRRVKADELSADAVNLCCCPACVAVQPWRAELRRDSNAATRRKLERGLDYDRARRATRKAVAS